MLRYTHTSINMWRRYGTFYFYINVRIVIFVFRFMEVGLEGCLDMFRYVDPSLFGWMGLNKPLCEA